MSLKEMSRRRSMALIAAMAVALAIMAVAVERIRFGGAMHHRNQAYSDVIADTLPPPLYVVESYLEVNRILAEPNSAARRLKRLAELQRDFRARSDHWHTSELPEALRGETLEQVTSTGAAFWREVDGSFTQALRRGDSVALGASAARLDLIYASHRAAVDVFVNAANGGQKTLAQDSQITLWGALVVLLLLGGGMIGAIFWLLRFLNQTVVAPVERLSGVMDDMARGHVDVDIDGTSREDEIGIMARATCGFRDALAARLSHEQQQQLVVEHVAQAMDELARGNLLHRITVNFAADYAKLRSSYNAAMDSLSETLVRASGAAESVNGGAREIRAASDDLASRTEQQAVRLEAAATSLHAVTGSISETARDAGDAAAAIDAACESSREGSDVVRNAISAMGEIERSAREISSIIEVIDGISFQTNLLALNAGVEAARAGEAGKGFAVVANEVRALSQRSTDAASEIRRLIGTSSEHVESGVALVNATGTVLQGIATKVSEVAGRLSAISVAASDQAGRVREISAVVSEMDRSTQQNAAMVEETTAAARSLSAEAETLRGQIARFKTGENQAPLRLAS